MNLYAATLQKPTGATHAIIGNFSGKKQQELIICRGVSILELISADSDTGKLATLLSADTFGIIRALMPIRLTGGLKDYIVLGTDSGRIMILEYNPDLNQFQKVHQEPFGKSGCRRITPGQFLAADPKGRAVMIAAVEKQKFVYVLNRDAENHLTISSPLESHKNHTLLYCCVGLDVGFENPIFACLDYDYHSNDVGADFEGDVACKMLSFFELDLGLNNVVKKWTTRVLPTSNLLIAIPGGKEGPGGVLVCSEGYLTWVNQNHQEVQVHFPRRADDTDKSCENLIISHVVHKMKNLFFVLVQTENGDLFKVTFEFKDDRVDEIKMRYFDTVPPALSLCIFKTGFLYVCAESGNNLFLQIESLGDEAGAIEWSSSSMEDDVSPTFEPKTLTHLLPVDESQSYNPILDSKVLNLTQEDTPQIYSICGTGPNSSLKVLRNGLQVSEMISYPLPGSPIGVWALKARREDEHHSYIVISFINATLVLSIGETVEEVTDTGFLLDSPTLDCCQMGQESLVQVHPRGVRHLKEGRVSEWQAPPGQVVSHSSSNGYQLAIALSAQEVSYFELDEMENLNEFQEKRKMSGAVKSIAVAHPSAGQKRGKFLAVGCADRTVRLLSLNPDSCMKSLGIQAVNGEPTAILISEFLSSEGGNDLSTFYLNVGLDTGVLVRTVLDSVTGALSDSRLRFIGSLPVKLFRVVVEGKDAVLALSSKPWLNFSRGNSVFLHPLIYETLEYGSSFLSEQCPEGILAIAENTLRILSVEDVTSTFHTVSIPLLHTPRQFVHDQMTNNFVIVESDHRCTPDSAGFPLMSSVDADGEEIEAPLRYISQTRAPAGRWASCIRVLNPLTGDTLQLIHLDEGEAAFSITRCVFYNFPSYTHYAVGTARGFQLSPRKCQTGVIRIYRMNNYNGMLEFVHETEVEDVPGALIQFQGRLLAGICNTLRIYDLGKKKMLRKSENKSFPNFITGLQTQGDRIYISDVQESIHMARYIYQENALVVFADDTLPRYVTKFTVLDYNTVCGADKFGNIFVKRLSKDDIEELEDDMSGAKIMHEKGLNQGAPKKLRQLCEYFVGDTVTSLQKCSLISGGREVILYTTLLGGIGILVPFASKEDVDLFTTLEMHMRQEAPPLSGRDHMAFRSYYVPVKAVVDGDLVELFNQLPFETKQAIADSLGRSATEISRQIELIRARVS